MPTYTDLELAKMEKKLNKIYSQAQGELLNKWDNYMKKIQAKADAAKDTYLKAMSKGDPIAASDAMDAYNKAMFNMTLQNKHYQEMVDQVTDKLADTNQIALDYLNGQMPKIYAHSYNELADQEIAGYSFELVNEEAVKYLVENGNTNLLPQKQLNIPKDKKWNTKQINSEVTQGILQGESIPKISARIFPEIMSKTDLTGLTEKEKKGIIKKNKEAAVRNARTMVTGAENKGRQDSFIKATNDGVIMKRIWVAATGDERTRDWHIELNGTEAAVDEPFENAIGQIMYPGDPTADPANVYNCRCAIRGKVVGFDWSKLPQESYADQYQGVGVTAQYYSMLDEDKALGNEFWKALNAEGKPSQVWKDYLSGNTSKEVTAKFDGILAKYKGTGKPIKPGSAKKAAKAVKAAEAPKPDLGMYQDKSMTATFYSVKAENKELGKEFWSILQAETNPSNTWKEYLTGVAPKDVTDKLDKILLQHKGTGAWTKPVSAKAATKAATKTAAKVVDKADDLAELEMKLKKYEEYEAKLTGFNGNGFKFIKDGKTVMMYDINDLDHALGLGWKPADAEAKEFVKWVKGVDKTELKDKIIDIKNKTKAASTTDDLIKAKEQLAVAQGNLDSLGNKTYTGIWKEPVTLSDYEAKAGSIQAKKDYYDSNLKKVEEKLKNGEITQAYYDNVVQATNKYLDELVEFENKGKIYAQYEAEYKLAAKKVKDLTPVGETFGPDAYTQLRKDNAVWAKSKQQADDVLREASGEVWRNAKTAERNAIYEYTSSYHKFNEPLRGIEYGSNQYKGVGKTDLNAGYQNNGKKLNAMTDILEKSKLPQDQWFQRGCRYNGMDKFFDCDMSLLQHGTQEELEAKLLGKTVTEHGFMSMGSAKGQGFSGDILMNIYTPEGTKAMYVEPFSAFGHGAGKSWDGISKQGSFGGELETILQQNTDFRITKIERKGGTLYFDLEVTAQNTPQRWKG